MNKILALVIALSLICGSVLPAFASDYEGHWAESIAIKLLNDGVISGDANGLRLDDNIKRSEFVKVINNAFSVPYGGTVNFPDVSADKWYFNDFLKAKNAGYLTGDQNGNANPESNIKRVEAAVILSRILGYSSEKTISEFKDDAKIPEWGKDAIYTLASKKIINGYTDGTFRADSALTRAEAFALVSNSGKSGSGSSDKTSGSTSVQSVSGILPSGSVSSGNGGSSGGGGGGGGGGSSSSTQSLHITWTDEENNTIHWNQVAGASVYTISVARKTQGVSSGSATDVTSSLSYNLTDLVKTIAPISERMPKEDVEVVVSTTVGGNVLTTATALKVSYPHVKTPEIAIVSEDNNGKEKLSFVWENDENAGAYTFNVNLDNTDYTTLSYTEENGKCIAEIPSSVVNSLSKTFPYKMEATATDSEIIPLRQYEGEMNNLLYASGEGTDASPYVIRYARHFRNISENPDADYYLAYDITLDQTASESDGDYYSLIENFTGNLTGYDLSEGKKAVKTITVNSTNGIGVFEKIENANIEKIKIAGSVTTTENVIIASPFIGTASGTSSITDCENTAELSVKLHGSTDPGTGRAGGIVGYNAGVTSFAGCINSANLKVENTSTASYLGGICGANSGLSAEKPSFTNCGNTGVLETASSCAAGIITMPKTATITGCYNVGSITSAGIAGGIVATTTSGANVQIYECYNSGRITSAKAAGIIATASGTAVKVTDSYNSGLISGTVEGKIAAESTATTNTIADCYDASASTCSFAANKFVLTNCYYLASATGAESNGLKPLSDGDMQILSNFGFDSAKWTQNLNGVYKYPQLIVAPHKFVAETLGKPTLSVNLGRTESKLLISGSANAIGYVVEIGGTEIEISGGGEKELDITAYVTSSGEYSVNVIAIGDGELYKDSFAQTITFEKEAFKFMPAIASVRGNEYDEYTVSWTINDTEGLSNYLLTVTDKESSEDIISDEELPSDMTSFIITSTDYANFEPGKEYIAKIKAVGTNPEESSEDYATKEFKTLFAEGSGTEEAPFVIRNERHFKNITSGSTSVYWLANDITLDQTSDSDAYVPIASFSGKLIGMAEDLSGEDMREIEIRINTTVSATGLFVSAPNVTVKNIRTTGEIRVASANGNIGGFAGQISGSGVYFENCENTAPITIAANSSTFAGGLVGRTSNSSSDKFNFINCINTGSITASGTPSNYWIGGILGNKSLKGTLTMTNCVNTGNISTGAMVGGLVASGGGMKFVGCSNSGNLSGYDMVGGLAGKTEGTLVVEKSFNIGEINVTNSRGGTTETFGGGLIANSLGTATVSDSYNAGMITFVSRATHTTLIAKLINSATLTISACYDASESDCIFATDTATMSSCYYLADTTDVETNGLTPLSADDMLLEESFAGFDWSTWNEPDSTSEYPYPTLK